MRFKNYTFKAGNMKAEQEFTLYPYTGGETITLQSDKRICKVNVHTGKGVMNRKNEQRGAYFAHFALGTIEVQVPHTTMNEIREHLKGAAGLQQVGAGLLIENKPLQTV